MTEPSADQLLDLAAQQSAGGQWADAEATYRRLLAAEPGNPSLLHELGVLAIRRERYAEARGWLEQAVAGDPTRATYFNNLGLALHQLGELEPALGCFEQALRLEPGLVRVFYNAGNVRLEQGRLDAAIGCYRRVLEVEPGHEWSHLRLGTAWLRKGDLDQALAAYQYAHQSLPGSVALLNGLGNTLWHQFRWEEAAAVYREVAERDPAAAPAWSNLGNVWRELGLIADAVDCSRRSVAIDPAHAEAGSNLIFNLLLHPGSSRAELARETQRWWLAQGQKLPPRRPLPALDRSPERRLRIGYVSPDLRDHPVGRHLLPVLRRHAPHEVEVVCYFDAAPADATTEEFRRYSSRWRESAGWSDDRLAAQVREDRIDLLLDLALHTGGNRLPMFARQPAPVQVSFAGYPGSAGLPTIAWHLSDRFLEPPGTPLEPGQSRPFLLPDSFWLFDPLGPTPEVGELPALASSGVVFACLSRFCKVNDPILDLWGELLQRVPDSRLLLQCPVGAARSRVLARLAAFGIAAGRVEFSARLYRPEYLELHRRIDIVLDPFPYNGHMTTCDALWMGVPVISLAGETPASRGGLSLLSNVGLPELVAFTPPDYVRLAADLAGDLPRLAALRAGLRARLQASPLMDAERFTRGIEAAYRAIWREFCAQPVEAAE